MQLDSIRAVCRLNNGVEMPYLGLGVFRTPSGEVTQQAVKNALECGYRHIDTARAYCNEKSVGRAIKASGLKREEIFVTTILWRFDFENPRRGLVQSLERLGLDYLDLYLLHWPFAHYVEAYAEVLKLQQEGLCRAVGVSNFKIHHLEDLKQAGLPAPQVNQVECHPENAENELLSWCNKEGIVLEAYSPLGGQGHTLMENPVICGIAARHQVLPVQVILRWNLQRGVIVIPKSVKAERIKDNAGLFNFSLSDADMAAINALNQDLRRAYDSDLIQVRPESDYPLLVEEA